MLKVDDACHHGKAGGQSDGEENKHPEPALRHQREAANNETATSMPSIAPRNMTTSGPSIIGDPLRQVVTPGMIASLAPAMKAPACG